MIASIAESTIAPSCSSLASLRRSVTSTSRTAIRMPAPTTTMSAISTAPSSHGACRPSMKAAAFSATTTASAAEPAAITAGWRKRLRLTEVKALGMPLERFIPQRFRGAHRGHIDAFGRTGVTSRRMGDVTTLWGLRTDGSEFPIEASISQVVEAGKRYFTVILRDISLRKQAEDALKRQQQELRELSAQVLEAREEEKTRIARELHDELGQLLTAVKMDLAALHDQHGEDLDIAAKLREVSGMVDQTVTATRRISADLRPLMLDDLGLADAAAWLVEEFGKRSNVRCSFEVSAGAALDDASKSVGTAVYRALQESLTNIARHSGAKQAWVQLAAVDGEIRFDVEDDGRGIAPQDMAKTRSLGLKGMRERLAYLGGSLEISAAPRGGTRLRGRVPAKDAREAAA